jgi:hypothetical protein
VHVIEYLHAEGCPFDDTVYLHAAVYSHVHVLQRLRELDCAWDSEQLCSVAAQQGLLQVLQWAKQQGAVFTERNMIQAAGQGHTAVCEYLVSQQCLCSAAPASAAARYCQVSTLQLLIKKGSPYDVNTLWWVAADGGHISVLSNLQQIGANLPIVSMWLMLLVAGANGHLTAAQWLRAQGAEWPLALSHTYDGEPYV